MTESTEMKTAMPVNESFATKDVAEMFGLVTKSFSRQCEDLDKKCRSLGKGVLDKTDRLGFFPRNENNYRVFYEEDIQYLQTFMDLRNEGKTIEEAAEAVILQRYGSEILDADETPAPQAANEMSVSPGMPMVTEDIFKQMLKSVLHEALEEFSDEMEKRNEATLQKQFEQLKRIEEKQDKILALEKRPAEIIPMAEKEIITGKTIEELLNEPEKTVLKVVPAPLRPEQPKKEVPLDMFQEPKVYTTNRRKEDAADNLTPEKPAFKMSEETVNKLSGTEVSTKKDGPFSKIKNFFVK